MRVSDNSSDSFFFTFLQNIITRQGDTYWICYVPLIFWCRNMAFNQDQHLQVCLFVFLTSLSTTELYRGPVPRLTSDKFTCETERGDHDFCLSQLHYTDTDPTSRERTQDLLSKSHSLYQLSYSAPPPPTHTHTHTLTSKTQL